MFKKRNISTTKAVKKKTLEPLSDSDDDSDNDNVVSVVKNPLKAKFKKFKPNTDKKDITGQVDYATIKPDSLSKGTDATKQNRLFAEDEEAYRKGLLENEGVVADDNSDDDGVYKGKRNYANYFDPKKKLSNKSGSKSIGPMKSASTIRSTTTFDFLPDVCKDYKQTGYCGYGDTCKFLHIRDDAKKGWKITKEWESLGKSKISQEKLETIPFKCPICKDDYKNPIITPCHHHFCQSCYLTHYKKKKSCFICGKNTGGSMVVAKDLKQLLLDKN